jgi:hypothetical protein
MTQLFGALAVRSGAAQGVCDETADSLDKLMKQLQVRTLNNMLVLRIKQSLLGHKSTDVDAEQLGTLIEQEMRAMDAAIGAAAERIKTIVDKSRATDTGVRLEVNASILTACTALMQVR